jgi:hypothetical protein
MRRIDRSSRRVASRLDALPCVCHSQPVNGHGRHHCDRSPKGGGPVISPPPGASAARPQPPDVRRAIVIRPGRGPRRMMPAPAGRPALRSGPSVRPRPRDAPEPGERGEDVGAPRPRRRRSLRGASGPRRRRSARRPRAQSDTGASPPDTGPGGEPPAIAPIDAIPGRAISRIAACVFSVRGSTATSYVRFSRSMPTPHRTARDRPQAEVLPPRERIAGADGFGRQRLAR